MCNNDNSQFYQETKLYDVSFQSYDSFTNYVPKDEDTSVISGERHEPPVQSDDNVMGQIRDSLCEAIYNTYYR